MLSRGRFSVRTYRDGVTHGTRERLMMQTNLTGTHQERINWMHSRAIERVDSILEHGVAVLGHAAEGLVRLVALRRHGARGAHKIRKVLAQGRTRWPNLDREKGRGLLTLGVMRRGEERAEKQTSNQKPMKSCRVGIRALAKPAEDTRQVGLWWGIRLQCRNAGGLPRSGRPRDPRVAPGLHRARRRTQSLPRAPTHL